MPVQCWRYFKNPRANQGDLMIKISRAWSMPNHNTLSIKPIKELFDFYKFGITVDPFARDCQLCLITNDLNPNTKAQFHMKADDFLNSLNGEINFVVFDPPYSLRQVKECYEGIGVGFTHKDTQNAVRWTVERDIIFKKQKAGDRVLSLGWTTTCMGMKRGYKILEILIVSHGSAHNDTLCTVEEKIN